MIATAHPLLVTAILVGAGLLLLAAEALWPRRARVAPTGTRWRTHLGFMAVNMPLERGVQALVLLGVYGSIAGYAAATDFGLLGLVDWPVWLEWALAVLALDFAVWAQHLVTHRVDLLWRFHRVHHADRDLDVSSALRFHPVEIALSMVYKMAVALAIGAPLGALVIFELLLSVFPLFNHANWALPEWLDRPLRLLVVTPDMHRVHHSVHRHEHDNNFGFCFSLWDRLFATYRAEPEGGQLDMTVGLPDHQDAQPTRWGWSMLFPFSR